MNTLKLKSLLLPQIDKHSSLWNGLLFVCPFMGIECGNVGCAPRDLAAYIQFNHGNRKYEF